MQLLINKLVDRIEYDTQHHQTQTPYLGFII